MMQDCPRYKCCSVPICPLDPDWKKRVYLKGEPKCTMEKNVRMRLGKNLKNKGLTQRELASQRNWNKLGAEEKLRRQANLRPFSKSVTAHKSDGVGVALRRGT